MFESSSLKRQHDIKVPIYKKWWFYALLLLLLFVAFFFIAGIPMLINGAYKSNKGYRTFWGASEVLSFYAVILSGVITIAALIITIHFSKKDTEKQLRFYMSRTKAPFFQIEFASGLSFNENHQFAKKYKLSEDGTLSPGQSTEIDITLKNIGDGIALTPSYRIDMLASTIVDAPVINKDSKFTLVYDLQNNLYDRFVEQGLKSKSMKGMFYTYITLSYQNMLGIDLYQTLQVEISVDQPDQTLNLVFNQMSPQKLLD